MRIIVRYGGKIGGMEGGRHLLLRFLFIVSAALMAFVFAVIFVLDSFLIKGNSMEPTLRSGQRVYVCKLLMGARIYKNYDFSSSKLSSFRMPGLRKPKIGDVLVFNYPYARSKDTIGFRINYVYAKRCLGTPGDSVSIVDGFYRGKNGRLLGEIVPQKRLHALQDSLLMKMNGCYFTIDGRNIKNFGPVYVPGKGDKVTLGKSEFSWYRKLIRFETGVEPEINTMGHVLLDGSSVTEYEFKGNWYFLGGDNVLDSRDSRYFGLVPEEYIVGIII